MRSIPRFASHVRRAIHTTSIAGAACVACNPAFADCQPNPPAAGATVTCTGPAPTSMPVTASNTNGITVNVDAGAVLAGPGVLLWLGDDAHVNNFGTIQPASPGSGLNAGVLVGNGSIVRNFGTMSTSGFNALAYVSFGGDNVLLSNEVGGIINVVGDSSAGLLTDSATGNTLVNAGRITMNTFQGGGMFAQFGSGNTLINTATGVIDTSQDFAFGINALSGSGHTLVNLGTIVTRGQASHAMILNAMTGSSATNGGTITTSGGASEVLNRAYGIFIAQGSGNTAMNLAGGIINASGLGASAMEVFDSANNLLRNEGTLNVSGAGAHGMYVVSGNNNTLDNRGVLNITGARGNGLRSDDGNTMFLNSGTILVGGGDAFGVYMQGTGNTLVNSGTIHATGSNADGVVSNTVAGSFATSIENTGTIVSDRRFAIRGVNGQETVVNAGTLRSGVGTAIDLRAGNDTLILRTGSQVTGLADGGTGTDITLLEGTGVATNDFANFETLRMTGSDWRFSGNGTFASTEVQAGVLRVDGSLTSPVSVQAGTTLQVGTGGASGTIVGNIANSGTLVFNRSDNVTYNGQVSGSGALVQQGPGVLTLGAANSYAGGTAIQAGTLAISADSALGAASGPLAFDGGTLRLNAAFDLAASRAITLQPGGGTVDTQGFGSKVVQSIGGTGGLAKAGTGTLVLAGANTFAGGTTIAAGTLQLGDGGSAGSIQGDVLNNGTLAFDRADAVAFAGTISGSGSVRHIGTGTTLLSAGNTYSGGTALKNGTLAVGHSGALGTGPLSMDDGTTLAFAAAGLAMPNPIVLTGLRDPVIDTGAFDATLSGGITGPADLTKTGTGTLTLAAANNLYSGATAVAAGTLRAGTAHAFSAASAHTVSAGATLDTGGFAQIVAALSNSGTATIVGSAPGNTLTVNGPYVGSNGLLRMGTALQGSSSVSDRLVLDGASATASGRTTIQFTNLGGLGAATTGNGIEVVSAQNGATSTAQTSRDAFALAGGHVDAGAYEYRLYPADADGGGENWFLRTTAAVQPTAAAPAPPGSPPDAPPSPPGSPTVATPAPRIEVPTYRAEVPLFAALPMQLRQGNLAMLGNLHQRVGDEDLDAAPGAPGQRRAWARLVSADLDLRQEGAVTPASQGRLGGLQTGVDLYAGTEWRAGLYAGQLEGSPDVSGFARGIADLPVGSNDLRSQYLGGYLTYGAATGFYADLVLQGGRHRQTLQPLQSAFVDSKGSSGLASIEIGQSFALSPHWKIEPQLQLAWQDLDIDDATLLGATVQQRSGNSWLARIGVRAKGELGTGVGMLQPYARVNFYRSGGGDDLTRFVGPAGGTDIASGAEASWGEVAAGLTLTLHPQLSLYGEAGQLFSVGGGDAKVRSGLQGSLGMRVRW